jgi:hypothetical protein
MTEMKHSAITNILLADRNRKPKTDHSSPAELYLSRPRRRHTDYRRFATAAEAIRYAVEELRTRRSLSAWMQVGQDRFNSRLYDEMIILCARL